MKESDVIIPEETTEVKLSMRIAELEAERDRLREALLDMLSGWKYIRLQHGDLYGVAWDRAEQKAEKALEES